MSTQKSTRTKTKTRPFNPRERPNPRDREYIRGQLGALMRAEVISHREGRLILAPYPCVSAVPERELPKVYARIGVVFDDLITKRLAREVAAGARK